MKKIISILMIVAMLVSIAVVNTSAAGQILLEDDFSGSDLNENNWIVGGNEFYVEQGWCKGWHQAVVCQSNYSEEMNKIWSHCSVSVDIAFFDYDNGNNDGSAGLWWKDYVLEDDGITGTEAKGNIYTLKIKLAQRQIELDLTGDYDTEDEPLAVYNLPEDFEITINEVNPSIINLGMRIQANRIDAYLNGQLVISYNTQAPIGTQQASPILLTNSGMYIGFDNFKVATVDYPLFAADLEPTPAPTDTNAPGTTPAPETSVQTSVNVVGTDADGNDVTEIVSQIVTVAPADTVTGGTAGGNGANTGDMAVIVVAVMVVALGTAIVVKKVSVK